MSIVKRTVACEKTFVEGADTFEAEQVSEEDMIDFIDLFPEYGAKIERIYRFLNKETPPEMVTNEIVETKKRTCNKMCRLDAENASRFIAEKCKNRNDLSNVVNDVYEYLNGKFSKPTIRNLLTGKTRSEISMRFFKINEKGKIIAF